MVGNSLSVPLDPAILEFLHLLGVSPGQSPNDDSPHLLKQYFRPMFFGQNGDVCLHFQNSYKGSIFYL